MDEIAVPFTIIRLTIWVGNEDIDSSAFTDWMGGDTVNVAGINVAEDFEMQNSEAFLDARNPATSLVCGAANLATFLEFLLNSGRTPDGQQLVSEKALKKMGWIEIAVHRERRAYVQRVPRLELPPPPEPAEKDEASGSAEGKAAPRSRAPEAAAAPTPMAHGLRRTRAPAGASARTTPSSS